MKTVYVTRRESFSASHRLFNPALSDDENIRLFDKCASPNGHGHNYELEVTVAGEPGRETGYVIDLKKLKQIIRGEIISKVDHKHLNYDVEFLRGINPTAENLVVAFWHVLASKISEGRLYSVRLRETENNVVECRGEE
ncbi:MAG: 6-carboxytetrahydropterin synthase [Ignavibacteriales bacterium]|nr:6-carboxytetrahydropterin synthase [Ignavibacteriales bacterium]